MSEHTGKKISTFRERFSELCNSNPRNDTLIAEELHVSKQTISAWKAGTRSPKSPTIITIANYFQVDVAWLMGFDVEKVPMSDKEYEEMKKVEIPQTPEARIISGGIDKMPPDRREQALKVLQTIFADYFDGGEKDET